MIKNNYIDVIYDPEKKPFTDYPSITFNGEHFIVSPYYQDINTIYEMDHSGNIIKEYSRIDNLVQIAHNVLIGKNTIIAAQVGIAGSVSIGNNVLIGGQTGIAGHLKIGNNVIIAGKSGDRCRNYRSGNFESS